MLLQTKLHIPKPRGDAVLRPRLIELLQANLDKPLILLTAPAGYGKTTLLAQFTADALLPVGWYQLDAGDNDPAIFFEYLVECLAGRYPEFGPTPRALLQSSELEIKPMPETQALYQNLIQGVAA